MESKVSAPSADTTQQGIRGRSITIGIAGCTSSGKTSLVSLLSRVLPSRTQFLHLDTYGQPFDRMPRRGPFIDCDSRHSYRLDDLESAIRSFKSDHFNQADCPSSEPEVDRALARALEVYGPSFVDRFVELYQSRMHESLSSFKAILVVEGIYLYHDSPIRDLLDVGIFLRTSREEVWKRRSVRWGDINEEDKDFWQTKAYFDACVWPNYESEHCYLFPGSDIAADLTGDALRPLDNLEMQPVVDASMEDTAIWVAETILGQLLGGYSSSMRSKSTG